MQLLTKAQLIAAATEAKAIDGYVGIFKTNTQGISIVIKSKGEYSKEREQLLANPDFIKGIQADNILKFDCDNWDLQDCSIDYVIEQINRKYGIAN